jgi:hypothetical protein
MVIKLARGMRLSYVAIPIAKSKMADDLMRGGLC